MRRLILVFALFLSSYNLYAGTISAGGGSNVDIGTINLSPPDSTPDLNYPESDGSDGFFDPLIDTILTVPSDGKFNFTGINIATGINLSFDRNGYDGDIFLLATDNIEIYGTVFLDGNLTIVAKSLSLESSASIEFDSEPDPANLSIFILNATISEGDIGIPSTGNVQIGGGGTIIPIDNIIVSNVPAPLSLILFSSALFSLLPIQHRKRIIQ